MMKRFIILTAFVVGLFVKVDARVWIAPQVPAEDLATVKSTTVGYLWNVEADAFWVNGMTSNVQACATRLTNGDMEISTPHRCTVLIATDGTVRFRLSSYSSYYLSCTNAAANNVVVNRTLNNRFTYEETYEGSHVYTLTSATLNAPLDVAWAYGGPLTLAEGKGMTKWAFIAETSVTNGAYALYKAKLQLFNLYKALAEAGKTGSYKDAAESAYEAYTATDATVESLQAAARKFFHVIYADITTPIDVSFLLVNADMVSNGTTDGWIKGSPSFSWAEFERYHSALTLEQDATLPIGTYDFGFRSLYRQDGSDAAPTFTVKASNTVKANVPLMGSINFGVTNATENNWKQGTTYFQPDGMKSCGQALAHGDAMAWAKDVVVDGSGAVNMKVSMTSSSQWLNWQGVTVSYKGVGQDALRTVLAGTISQATTLYGDGTGNEAASLKDAIDQAQAVYDNPEATNAAISVMNETLTEVIEHYRKANASETNPIDYTSLITNPSFEDGTEGWTIDGMGTQGNSVFSIKAGNTYLERWVGKGSKVGDGNAVQTIKDLPVGKYQLKVAAQNIQEDTPSRAQSGAWIVANTDSQKVTTRKQYTLTFTNIENDAIIGFVAEGATGNWLSCDNFRLYYIGGTDEDLYDALQRYMDNGGQYINLKMHNAVKNLLGTYLDAAWEVKEFKRADQITKVSTQLRLMTETARLSVEAYAALGAAINEAVTTLGDGSAPGADAYSAAIEEARAIYKSDASLNDELYAAIDRLEDAKLLFMIQSPTGGVPTITTDSRYARGATMAFGRFTYKLNGAKLKEAGFCYSTERNPTIFDGKSTRTLSNNGLIYVMENLKPATVYYARPYILTTGYQVSYGDELKIITIPKGTMIWWYNNGGSAEENDRINYALQNGTTIWNNLMNIQGVGLSVSYGSGTPTADCSYGGSMRVGPNSAYQRTGTIMHEAAHGVGVGTIEGWWALLVDGVWTGVRANEVLQFWDNDKSAKMHGDSMHMWPYGINGAQEDSGTDLLYYGNALIIEGLHEDGVQPTGSCFASPAYTYEHEDTVKYYIQNENTTYGRNTSFLQASGTNIKWTAATATDLAADDSYAWYITFDPKTQYYSFKNASTGAYITYSSNSFRTAQRNTPTTSDKFQLMPSRQTTRVTLGSTAQTVRGYWILKANGASASAMTGASNGNVSSTNFDNDQNQSAQRWLIFASEDVIDEDTAIREIENDTANSNSANGKRYNLQGQRITTLQRGLNIVDGKKIWVK